MTAFEPASFTLGIIAGSTIIAVVLIYDFGKFKANLNNWYEKKMREAGKLTGDP